MKVQGIILSAAVLLLLHPVSAVKSGDFKTCSQSGFCRRGRAIAARARDATASWKSPYSVDASSVSVSSEEALITAKVQSSLYPDVDFRLEMHVEDDGVVRVRMDEVSGLRKRYDEAADWALVKEPTISSDIRWTAGKKAVSAAYGAGVEVVLEYEPLRVVVRRHGKEQVVINGRGLLHMEHFRTKETPVANEEGLDEQDVMTSLKANAWFEGEDQDAYWEESFSKWTDSKPKGPESLSVDIDFPNHGHVYGIPEHATSLSLPTTTGDDPFFTEPYRLYNLDVFEYIASSPMSLYGAIPLMHAHSAESTVGVFHVVGSETWIDVAHPSPMSSQTHWISESGILDLFILPGPSPDDVFAQYARLTGTAALPAHWALGYHQCRWNYVSSDDVRGVQKQFDEADMPVDVFWLDIEYAEEHKYMIWDQKTFPDPINMTNDVAAFGRKMVAIVDPHLKRAEDYPVYSAARDKGLLIKQSNGEDDFEGWCWSGSSAWVDFFNPDGIEFWAKLFDPRPGKEWSWTQSTEDIYIWNDMNEPSIFNGPEITLQKDAIHYGGWEHRDVHNINGMPLVSAATSTGLIQRGDVRKRPFVLTRSFFAGTQRYGAMWTGDNLGTWEHMAVGIKMVLSSNIAGMVFAGSDVGGFFGNPDAEMLVRWYHVGIFSPFLRAHAHIDTKRREPYLLTEPYKSYVRNILRLRYSMLPVWYTAFRENSETGRPVVRPHYAVFPQDLNGFAIDDQFFLGSSGLLVKPVTRPGVTEETVYIPEDEVYYEYFSHQTYHGSAEGKNVTVPAPLDRVPLLVRGGSIVPTRERPRRSSSLMAQDPFTLRVALSKSGAAKGELYLDDGVTFAHRDGALVWREFIAAKTSKTTTIKSRDLAVEKPFAADLAIYDPANAFSQSIKNVRVEKVIVLGLSGKPSSVMLTGGGELVWEFEEGAGSAGKEERASVLTIKDPKVGIAQDWEVKITL
ncbi:glycoside hydrolase family 31 protein [Vararia minispora EC-137]|uniref:Glycoside hydrolase family 31 protein n=1 Tax=Vararia minispora EC-137 TaxID=1314806 RepID=A0ACB8QUS9_9AGAM|nr:glycoside hydrolase family 31 protein [Vararia minispora EC-137]